MREYLESMLKSLALDDPYHGTSVKGFLHLMQNYEAEIIEIVYNYSAVEKCRQLTATEACYNVMRGDFLEKDADPTDLFVVADALGRDDDKIVRKSRDLQFVYAVLWNIFMNHIREVARETMREIRGEFNKAV